MLRCFATSLFPLLCANFSSFGDDYKLGPDSMPQAGVTMGRVEGPFQFKSQVFTNTLREYWMFVCP